MPPPTTRRRWPRSRRGCRTCDVDDRPRRGDGGRVAGSARAGHRSGHECAKALLVDVATGAHAGRGHRAYPSAVTEDGAHEQAPDDWWTAATAAVRDAVGDTAPHRVRAVGLSGHMHAVVLIDEHDRPVRPALTWADRRSAEQVRRLRQSQDVFTAACSNPVVEAFTAPKLAWVADHEPQALARARRLVQPKDVLRHRLTGSWGTDTTDACGTLLYDIRRGNWDEEAGRCVVPTPRWRRTSRDRPTSSVRSRRRLVPRSGSRPGPRWWQGPVTSPAPGSVPVSWRRAPSTSMRAPRPRCRQRPGNRSPVTTSSSVEQAPRVTWHGLCLRGRAECRLGGGAPAVGSTPHGRRGSAARRHGDHRGRRSSGRRVRPAPARHQRAGATPGCVAASSGCRPTSCRRHWRAPRSRESRTRVPQPSPRSSPSSRAWTGSASAAGCRGPSCGRRR